MSDALSVQRVAPLSRTRLIVIITVSILIFVYIGGYFLLPSMIKSAFRAGNCPSVLSRDAIYSTVYPFADLDEHGENSVRECAIYTFAVINEDAEAWKVSYNAFDVYLGSYPQGTFADDAHEHIATVLLELVQEDVERKKYTKAYDGLDFILLNYADTPQAVEAENLKSELRMALGTELRDTGDFANAEKIFKDVNAPDELAQTYLAWGLELQNQQQFTDAKAKLEMAISTDPDPSSVSGPAAQAKASQADLYTQWGDYLIEQKDFANAMERYERAASLLEDRSKSNEIVAKGYIQWAADLTAEEDFSGALVLLDFAQDRSAAETISTLVDDARSDLYLAFSKSEGEQAQKAMDDAVRIVCEHQTESSLPIFGLDDENIRVGVDGIEDRLSESIAATTPASLHYVACVGEEIRKVQKVTITYWRGWAQRGITYESFQHIWNIVLREMGAGQDIDTIIIEGGKPEVLSRETVNPSRLSYFGEKPVITDLEDWLLPLIE